MSAPKIEVVALVIPQAGNLRFSPFSSHLTHDIPFFSLYLTMRPLFAGPSALRPPRPDVSPSSSASMRLSDGVPRERERSPHAPIPCRAVQPTTPPSDNDTSDEYDDDDECEDSQSAIDASLTSRDVLFADAFQGLERESTSLNSGPSSHSSSSSSSGSSSFEYCSGSSASSSDTSSEDDLVDRYSVGTFPLSMP
ncbi:hypothetical protein PIB30_027616 [Stylosanthes scabra]|uniref:Uncharacterized protein n=1 Tax=Stylosanthes scabra TaxID=79078 RepID=A0ABU6Y901_9FABA|nr:hypothetical protein [Stylosanthes scabra]